MKVVSHPYLEGVLCRADGAIYVPASGVHKAHWTFGSAQNARGYLQVQIAGKHYRVNRLICETFHGLCPADKPETDHLDRDPTNNAADNLRWIDRKGNARNRGVNEASFRKYGVVAADDKAAYDRARYANDPEYRERKLAHAKAYAAKKRAKPAL